MLLRTLRRAASARHATMTIAAFGVRTVTGAAFLLAVSTANAQFYGGYDPGCGCSTSQPVAMAPPVYQQPSACSTCAAAPVVQAAPVCQTAMVVQPCYQTVPVTEYQEIKQTVMRPKVETAYIDQPVTEYRPITETRTVEQPYTTYQPVCEQQTVMRDRGYYTTTCTPNCRQSPCQYDCRPGLLGWMNRTGYEMRSAFTPRYTVQRNYVPNMVAETVPVTRYVAQQQSRQVSYNVTRMEAYQTTRKVAVNTTSYVAEEVTAMRPVTTYRTVPVGTTVAYAPLGSMTAFGSSATPSTAFGPTPDAAGARSAAAPTKIPSKTAEKPNPNSAPFERTATPTTSGDFGKNPAGAELRVPSFRRLSAADREELLQARRIARGEAASPAADVAQSRQTFKTPAETTNPSMDVADATNTVRQETLRNDTPALAAAFVRPTALPGQIRTRRWTGPTVDFTGPELLAPTLASVE